MKAELKHLSKALDRIWQVMLGGFSIGAAIVLGLAAIFGMSLSSIKAEIKELIRKGQ